MIDFFWLTTLIPGFAALQVLYPEDLRYGLLPTISWCYVLTVAIMAPIVALAFAVHLSVQTVGVVYLGLVVGGSIIAIRAGGLRRLARLLRSTHWFEVGLILGAIALTVPLGAAAQSDAFAHSAKVRYIRDVGFYLQDAYSPLQVIETKWHVNVHHAYFAVASWLGGSEPLDLWYRAAWFFRLLAVGAIGFLAAMVFRSRWIGTLAMLGSIAFFGSRVMIVMPFSVSGYAIVPILLALVVDVLERPSGRRYGRVVLCSLGLAVLHVGTWFLAVLATGPIVAVATLWGRRLKEWWRPLALASATLLTGAPFLLVSALQPNYVKAQQDALHVRFLRTIDVGHGSTITVIDPTHFAWALPLLAGLFLLAVVSRHLRFRTLTLAGVVFTAMLFMFTPGIFDLVIRLVPYWLLERLSMFVQVIGLVIVTGGVVWITRSQLRVRLARQAMALLVLCASLAIFRTSILNFALEVPDQRGWLREARNLQETVRSILPAHTLVLADPAWSLALPAVQLVRVMAADLHHANPADGGLLERYADSQELLAEATPPERRRELLAKHGVKFILIRDEPGAIGSSVDFDGLARLVIAKNRFRVYEVTP